MVDITLLEEILHLVNSESLQTLKLLAELDGESQSRKMVTRGANRERQGELNDIVQMQIKKVDEPIEATLKSFFISENLCFPS